MAQTLPNGTVVPNESGNEIISATGVAEMRALGTKADAEAVELGAGADANTLTTPGRYVETNAADAATIVNFPEQRAGVLDVAANADRLHVWQVWRPYTGNRMHMRSRTGGAWNAWEQIINSTDSRLTDARPPTAHTHALDDVTGLAARLAAMEYDSGARDLRGYLANGATADLFTVQRVGRTVTVSVVGLTAPGDSSIVVLAAGSFPAGFRPIGDRQQPLGAINYTVARLRVLSTGTISLFRGGGGQSYAGILTYLVPATLPTTLPGDPA